MKHELPPEVAVRERIGRDVGDQVQVVLTERLEAEGGRSRS